MDPRAVKRTELDVGKPYFTMKATKQDGSERLRYYAKFNHAIRALYRIQRIETGSVSVKLPKDTRSRKVITRIKRKRGMNTEIVDSRKGRPILKAMGRYWHRMPRSPYNDIE